jgi:hypothetical protein
VLASETFADVKRSTETPLFVDWDRRQVGPWSPATTRHLFTHMPRLGRFAPCVRRIRHGSEQPMSEMLLREALANVTSGGWTDDERIEKVVGYQQTNMTASAFFSERVLVGGRAAIFQSRGDHPHPRFAKILDDRPHSEAAKVPRPTRWHRRLRRVHGERHVVRPHCNMKYNTQCAARNV